MFNHLEVFVAAVVTSIIDLFISFSFFKSIYKGKSNKIQIYTLFLCAILALSIVKIIATSTIMTFTSIAINFFIVTILFSSTNVIEKILYVLSLSAMGVLTEAIVAFSIMKFLVLDISTLNSNFVIRFYGEIISKLILYATIIIFKRYKCNGDVQLPIKYTLYLMVIPVISILIIYKFRVEYLAFKKHGFEDILFIIAIIFSNFIVFKVYDELVVEYASKLKYHLAKHQLATQIHHYNALLEKRQKTLSFMHDFKNHMFCIDSLAAMNLCELIRDYLRDLNIEIENYQQIVDSGHPVIDAIISEKKQDAQNNRITFKYDIRLPPIVYISDIDLCVLIGNALDNAIEACNRLSVEKKEIDVLIIERKSFMVIQISNSVDEGYSFSLNRYISSKSDKEIHGFGIENMEKIVDKYNGNLQASVKDNKFVLHLVLQRSVS